MRARVITTKAAPEVVEAGVQLTKDVLAPNARGHEGYRGYILLYDREGGLGIAVTLWDDAQTEVASDASIRASREEMAKAFGAEVRVDKYDVGFVEIVDP